MIKAGRLRHRIYLQSKTVTRDSFGGETVVFKTESPNPIWAGIEPLSAREYFVSQQMKSEVTHKVTIRYFSGLQMDWRVLWGTRQFDIVSIINPEERNREIILLCTEWIS